MLFFADGYFVILTFIGLLSVCMSKENYDKRGKIVSVIIFIISIFLYSIPKFIL